MTTGLRVLTAKPYLSEETILVGYRGSIAHGMYIPNTDPDSVDDKDIMAIVVPDLTYYYGLNTWGSRGTREHFIDELDIVSYEVRKFIELLAKANPNVLSLLWLNNNHYIKITDEGQKLIDNRRLFATKKAYHSFCGYAHSQLKKMEAYSFKGYMGEKRKKLVDKFGYDTKNAAHLVRLLRMGIEFLNEGELHVHRQDAPELLHIKRGGWSLKKVKAEADRLFRRMEAAYDNCTLPAKPNMKAINDLSCDIIRSRHT
jgi:predicted nucleotidyltransferase